jgi:ammonia channel protein AmtB
MATATTPRVRSDALASILGTAIGPIMAGDRVVSGPMHELRGTAIAIAVLVVASFTMMGAVIVVLGWIGFSVYALLKMTGGGSDEASATGIMVGVVLMVTTLAALLAVMIKLVGRAMEPRKRGDRALEDGF